MILPTTLTDCIDLRAGIFVLMGNGTRGRLISAVTGEMKCTDKTI